MNSSPCQQAVNLRELARSQFERRSAGYQGGLAQRLYCRPTCRMLLEQFTSRADMRVLDVGCGTGQLLRDLRRLCPTLQPYGLDLSAGMIRQARALLGPEAVLQVGDSAALPFDEGTFDAVVCTHSFHHYPDQGAVLREVYRVLRPGGSAFVLDGNRDSRWGWLLYDVFVVWAEGPVRHRSAHDMRVLYHEAGFVNVRQHQAFPFRPVLLTRGVRAYEGTNG